MTPARLALVTAEARLVARLQSLDAKLTAGNETAWPDYCQTAAALAAITPLTLPGASGQLLTTAQLAARMQVSPKTIRRRAKAGELEPVRMGKRGRGALRWPA